MADGISKPTLFNRRFIVDEELIGICEIRCRSNPPDINNEIHLSGLFIELAAVRY